MKASTDNILRHVNGLVVNALLGLSGSNSINHEELQKIVFEQGLDLVGAWVVPARSLHITLFDLVSPLVDYGNSRQNLIDDVRRRSVPILKEIMAGSTRFQVTFSQICCSGGVLWIEGHDGGEFASLRTQINRRITPVMGTKPAPSIIHVTLVRNITPAQAEFRLPLTPTISADVGSFCVVNEKRWPMDEYNVMDTFHLKDTGSSEASGWALAA